MTCCCCGVVLLVVVVDFASLSWAVVRSQERGWLSAFAFPLV
jgi:hypothetical protein